MTRDILLLLAGLLLLLALATTTTTTAGATTTTDEGDGQEMNVRSHSLQSPYIDTNMENRYWDFGGATVVNTNKYLRLTPDRQSRKGWLWSKEPLNYDNWSIEFEFHVHGAGSSIYGDGFAFWVTRERATPGDVFGNRDMFTGLGVFFDTYPNSKHTYGFPYVSVMIGDGRTRYSNADDNEVNSLGGCQAYFRGQSWPTRARVTYHRGTLTVALDVKGKDQFEDCVSVSGYQMPNPAFIGFTAATGDVADNHDILKVTTNTVNSKKNLAGYVTQMNNNNNNQNNAGEQERSVPPKYRASATRKTSRDESEGWGFFTWLLVVVGAVALLGVGTVAVAQMTKSNKKRF